MKSRLGRLETMLLAYAQMRKLRTLRTGDLIKPLGLSRIQEKELFRRLARGGLIARVQRGLYLLPPRLPLSGVWTPSETEAINALMKAVNGRYQICGPNAFNRYGFDDQIPNRLYAYNNRLSGNRKIGAVELTLIKVPDKRLGNAVRVKTPEKKTAVYSSRVRSLVDAVYDWSRCNGIPRGYEWIQRELRSGRVSADQLVRCVLRFGDVGTIRRIGALLERVGVDERLRCKLERVLKPTAGKIPWIPSRPKKGAFNRRWGVVMNDRSSGQ